MKVSVLGCGRWGSFHASYSCDIGNDVVLWGRKGSQNLLRLQQARQNDYIYLPNGIALTDDLSSAVAHAEVLIVSISAQQFRGFAEELAALDLKNKVMILCMKGIEQGTGKRLSEVAAEYITDAQTAVWVGPGHVQSYVHKVPNCMLIASGDDQLTKWIVEQFNSDLIRLYIGEDLIGAEVGAAAKNVVGIAAGMLDGVGYSSLKGALMARGAREVARLIKAMGGEEITAYGLSHLGDYEATLFSQYSNNRRFGEAFVRGEAFDKLAEGAYTTRAMLALAQQYDVELPITQAMNDVLYEKREPMEALRQLFRRTVKGEF